MNNEEKLQAQGGGFTLACLVLWVIVLIAG